MIINNLTISTLKGRVLLKDFSFTLNDNDKIALIGEEGNGKSTLLKLLAGQDLSEYINYSGSINTANEIIGYLPQQLSPNQLQQTPFEFLSNNDEYDIYNNYAQVIDTLNSVNLDLSLIEQKRPLITLSGGERVKLAMCKIILQGPDILLLDEPTNDLDLETLIWLEEFIKQSTLPIIFISHDDTLLEECSNGILHLEQLKRKQEPVLTYSGVGYGEYLQRRMQNIERTNMIAAKEKSQLAKQLEKYRQIYQKVDYQQKTITRQDPHGGQLLKKKMHAVKALGRKLEEKENNLTQKIEPEEAINIYFDEIKVNPKKVIIDFHLDNLMVAEKKLSSNINLFVSGKDKIAIIGKNGCGKSTLLKMIHEQLKNRDDISLGYMPQNYEEVMNYSLNPVDFLKITGTKDETVTIRNYLGALKFTSEEMNHSISALSEGQKCKILLLSLILNKCNVLLLDEPTRNLSPLSNPQVRQMLINYGGAIITVTHDRKFINEVCTKVYQLSETTLSQIE